MTEKELQDIEAWAKGCAYPKAGWAFTYLELVTEVRKLQQERDNWIGTARQHLRNEEFYHGIVTKIGETFGVDAETSDDGSVQDRVLALKVPELVAALRSELYNLREVPVEGERFWFCKIGPAPSEVPNGGDSPLRRAVSNAFIKMFGEQDKLCSTGWGAHLTETEREAWKDR